MEQLELLLLQFLMPDNEARRNAEEQIKQLAKDPQLVPALLHQIRAARSPNVRQLAAVLLRKKITGHWMKLTPQIRDSVKSSLLEGIAVEHSPLVRRASANVVSIVAKHAVPTGEWPELLPFLFQCSQSAQEDLREVALILFSSLTETIGGILRPHFATLQSIFVSGLRDQQSSRVRIAALKAVGALVGYIQSEQEVAIQIISWLSKYKPKTLVKNKVVAPILAVMCQILAEPDYRRDEDDVSADRAAAEVLDTMAMSLPKKHVFPPVLNFAISNFQNADYNYREAAVMSLGVISEGCFEIMKSKMSDILNLVLEALKDSEQAVRGAASFALGQFAEHLQPEIVEHYERVLPCIFLVLSDSSAEVQEKAYYALAAFCENLGQEILPYLAPLMEKLLDALQSGRRDLQETCMSAIGSAAAASELAFTPYAAKVLELLRSFMALKKDEDLPVRARATELVGIIGMAVGRDYIQPALPSFIEATIEGFSLDFSELREYSHGFFSNVAEILEEGLVQYLPRVVPLALASCNLDDGTALDFDDSDSEGEMANGFGGVSSDEDEKDDRRVRNFSVRTGVLDEKAAATQALGLFALHTKSFFMPYLEDTLSVLKKHAGYFHEDVRLQAVIALQRKCLCHT
ncbi:hypothetical protein O6H91_18G079600 [Diphasiastrum complanatum]|uniref:Uncharacterized protein n=1 Tax=Diphasiastrum complanatum TaxID=34168 RepID=A0ACC2B3X9_DIPCM|nr:hypothetical protein O6H91_18G079600 [Diphasiastrum complanatum]